MMEPTEKWTDSEWGKFDEWIRGVLRTVPEVTVTFIKKDGTERIMKCTLEPSVLPKQELLEDQSRPVKAKNDNVVVAYDIEAKGWRSFTLRAVKRVAFSI